MSLQVPGHVLATDHQPHAGRASPGRDGSYVTDAEVDKAIDAIKAQAKDQNQSLEEYVARQGVTMDTVRHELIGKSAGAATWNGT